MCRFVFEVFPRPRYLFLRLLVRQSTNDDLFKASNQARSLCYVGVTLSGGSSTLSFSAEIQVDANSGESYYFCETVSMSINPILTLVTKKSNCMTALVGLVYQRTL